jgi:hypothetical protein
MNNTQSTDLYGRVMLSIEGASLLSHEKDLISNPHVGGIIFLLEILYLENKLIAYVMKFFQSKEILL